MSVRGLSAKMVEVLGYAVAGIRKYPGGYYPVDAPGVRVDVRTLNALYRRGLVGWQSVGGCPQRIVIKSTEEGEMVYRDLAKGVCGENS